MRGVRTRHGALAGFAAALALLPQAAAGQTGGQPVPGSQEAGPVDPGFQLSARRSLLVGATLRVRGVAPGNAGTNVRIERSDPSGLWVPVGAAETAGDGSFRASWRPDVAGRFTLRAVLGDSGSSQATAAARSSAPRPVTVYRPASASWYGPGFYGRRTACGRRLGRTTLGVAHRGLACGTPVAIAYRGKSIVVPVIDRGPFVSGIQWDLTGAAAKRLGVTVTSRVGVLPLRRAP
jgi:rare lipoprotein A